MACVFVVMLAAAGLVGCGDDDTAVPTATQNGAAATNDATATDTDTATSAPASQPTEALPSLIGNLACEGAAPDQVLQVSLGDLCVGDVVEQCSIGQTGLIRGAGSLEWDRLEAAVLTYRVDGEYLPAEGKVTLDGASADFEGTLADGRVITASVNCTGGP